MNKSLKNEIIQKMNPVNDDYHVWIRSEKDINTLEEAINNAKEEGDFEEEGSSWGDVPSEVYEEALKTGKITVYSSYPIENGTFVTPSFAQAYEYAGHDKNAVYSAEVDIDDVAWINVDEGMYASEALYLSKDLAKISGFEELCKEYTDVVNINLPRDREEYLDGLGESMLVHVKPEDAKRYYSDTKDYKVEGILSRSSGNYPNLEKGTRIEFELNGESRPVVDADYLKVLDDIKGLSEDQLDYFVEVYSEEEMSDKLFGFYRNESVLREEDMSEDFGWKLDEYMEQIHYEAEYEYSI